MTAVERQHKVVCKECKTEFWTEHDHKLCEACSSKRGRGRRLNKDRAQRKAGQLGLWGAINASD